MAKLARALQTGEMKTQSPLWFISYDNIVLDKGYTFQIKIKLMASNFMTALSSLSSFYFSKHNFRTFQSILMHYYVLFVKQHKYHQARWFSKSKNNLCLASHENKS